LGKERGTVPQVIAMMNKEMLYYINPEQQTPEELKALLEMHPEIKFVSFMGVDFAGNDTDHQFIYRRYQQLPGRYGCSD
jgi:hypothetical protein